MLPFKIAFAILLLATIGTGSARAEPNCAQSGLGELCGCNLEALKPLQSEVGMKEVEDKLSDIQKDPTKEAAELRDDPILVVRDKEGELFIVDHHHGALAWLRYLRLEHKPPQAWCRVVDPRPAEAATSAAAPVLDRTELSAILIAGGRVRLTNKDGQEVKFDQLPQTLDQLKDDPYRTLAAILRRKQMRAWCRYKGAVEFAEFYWADFLRDPSNTQPEDVLSEKAIGNAAARARSFEACKKVGWEKGYIGNGECPAQPKPIQCN